MKFINITKDENWDFKTCFMEFLGTFALCYVGGWACLMSDLGKTDLTGVALAHMFVLGFMVWAGGNISGAHYNPAVTVGLYATQHISLGKFLLYILSQFIGSLTAGGFLAIFVQLYTQDRDVFKSKLGYPHANIDDYGLATCAVVEFLATFFLVFMVYSTAVHDTKPSTQVYGLTIGGALGMAILSIGPITGAALNPMRVLGPAIISCELFTGHYSYAWIYYAICTLGGLFSALIFKLVFMRESEDSENENQNPDEKEGNVAVDDGENDKLMEHE